MGCRCTRVDRGGHIAQRGGERLLLPSGQPRWLMRSWLDNSGQPRVASAARRDPAAAVCSSLTTCPRRSGGCRTRQRATHRRAGGGRNIKSTFVGHKLANSGNKGFRRIGTDWSLDSDITKDVGQATPTVRSTPHASRGPRASDRGSGSSSSPSSLLAMADPGR